MNQTNNKSTKQEYQKRSLLIQNLTYLLELDHTEPVARILYTMLYPVPDNPHPYNIKDNELLGIVEKEIYKIENGIEDEE